MRRSESIHTPSLRLAAGNQRTNAHDLMQRMLGETWPKSVPDLSVIRIPQVERLQNCASDGSKPAAARSGVFSTDTTSRSKKCCKQPNGSEQMWRERAAAGYESKVLPTPLPPDWMPSRPPLLIVVPAVMRFRGRRR